MATSTENPNIRISTRSKAILRELAQLEGRPMQAVLDEAIEKYRRDRFFHHLDEGYARLQSDPAKWQEELDERRQWDTTSMDGLEEE